MFNYIGVGERAGSGVPSIYSIWKNENYEDPIVEEQSGREGTICTVITLP
jgi:predicted HTH transcriptional regulator